MELFFCQAQSVSMSRESCGKLWDKAETLRRDGAPVMGAQLMQCKTCLDCPLGKMHFAGEKPTEWPPRDREHWPKGPINIRVVDVRPFATEPPKKPAAPVAAPVKATITEKPKTALRVMPQDMSRPKGPPTEAPVQMPPRPLPPSPKAPPVMPPSPAAPTVAPPVPPAERAKPKKRNGAGRPAALYTHGGEVLTADQWAKRGEIRALGITAARIRMRRNKGWDDDKILTTPVDEAAAGNAKPVMTFDGLAPEVVASINEVITSAELSPRESDTLIALVKMVPRAELASAMDISENTVKRLVNRIAAKTKLRNSQEVTKHVLKLALAKKSPTFKMQPIAVHTPLSAQGAEALQAEARPEIKLPPVESETARQTRIVLDEGLVVQDGEIAAMARISSVVSKLSVSERKRVFQWVRSRYGE